MILLGAFPLRHIGCNGFVLYLKKAATECCLIIVTALEQDFLTISTGKRKHDEISSGYFIPQRDGADDELSTSMGESSQIVVSSQEKILLLKVINV